jgi:hypothetical protein
MDSEGGIHDGDPGAAPDLEARCDGVAAVAASAPEHQAGSHRGRPPPDGLEVVQEHQAQHGADPRHHLPLRQRLGIVLDSGIVWWVP